MFTFETADQKEVRRFRIAQFNGRPATVRSDGSTVTGHVRAVQEIEEERAAALDHHHYSDAAEGGNDTPPSCRARAEISLIIGCFMPGTALLARTLAV